MIDFQAAHQIVIDHQKDFGTETIPLNEGMGRLLRENWYADRPLPPFNRVAMDGIAVHYANAIKHKSLKVEGVVAAGDPASRLLSPDNCVEIMTGAVLTEGCDTVIRYEDITIEDGKASIHVPYEQGQNIHRKGIDRKEGELLVAPNTRLSAAEIGVGASVGRAQIQVARLPRTIVISTGNELVEIDQQPAPHQIRRGNVYRIQATLAHHGLAVDTAHLLDDKPLLKNHLADYLESYDLIILSGGVSKGKFDYLPDVLSELGVEKHFHRVAQRPGKPFWFGTHATTDTTVFALPGNPVSSFMCTQVYLLDWLNTSLGLSPEVRPQAILQEKVQFKPELTYFLEAKISYNEKGELLAFPKLGHGSGDLANLMKGDAFISLPAGRNVFERGEVFPIYWYR